MSIEKLKALDDDSWVTNPPAVSEQDIAFIDLKAEFIALWEAANRYSPGCYNEDVWDAVNALNAKAAEVLK